MKNKKVASNNSQVQVNWIGKTNKSNPILTTFGNVILI